MLGGADRLYAAWLGGGHADAALALRGLGVTAFVALATGMGTSVARGIGRTDLEAWFAFVALAVHTCLSLWLLPLYGLKGALIAILAGNVVGAAFFLTRLARALNWPLWRAMLRPCLVPALAIALATLAGVWIDHLLPHGPRALEWAALAAVAAASAGAALAVLLAGRHLPWREARDLLLRRSPAK